MGTPCFCEQGVPLYTYSKVFASLYFFTYRANCQKISLLNKNIISLNRLKKILYKNINEDRFCWGAACQ